jgi:hypothetical protein
MKRQLRDANENRIIGERLVIGDPLAARGKLATGENLSNVQSDASAQLLPLLKRCAIMTRITAPSVAAASE